MASDASKHLERAKRFLEKNKLREAVQEYQAVLEMLPSSQDALQSLGDLHLRLNEPERAAYYYGMLFDRLVDSRDAPKAAALYARFLKPVRQPAERVARYALLLQWQNKREEAIEHYSAAAELYFAQNMPSDALACWEKIAQLDAENPERHLKIGEVGEKIGKTDVAARAYLRAGQLALAIGQADRALEIFARAHRLSPEDRSVALVYADALLRKGEAQAAFELLVPCSASEADPFFLQIFGEALLRTGQLDRAREAFELLYQGSSDDFEKLFEVADHFFRGGQNEKGVQLLERLKERMFASAKQNDFTTQLERVAEANPKSLGLTEFRGRVFSELNREATYFDVLVRLFDLHLEAGNTPRACEALDRLVDIDPYDFRNHERVERLEGKVDPAYLRGLTARLARTSSVTGHTPAFAARGEEVAAPLPTPGSQTSQVLEDLLVQTEIFLQYSLHDKATERLRKIAETFPGEEEQNERLRKLYNQANWWPPGSKGRAQIGAPAAATAGRTGVYTAETLRDLAKISEITRSIYRQSTPKAVLSAAVSEVCKYLRVSWSLGVVGPAGQSPQMAAESCAAGMEAIGGRPIVKLLGQFSQSPADALGAVELQAATAPVLREMNLETALGVPLTDKETQAAAGMLIAGHATPHRWKPNESYFLQAVGDQMLLAVNHVTLRSLMRSVAVADEKTGLLGRSAYQDCLLAESNRAKAQGTPLTLVILQIDRGTELLRQHGEALIERYVEQLARALQPGIRQTDLAVKYTAWALAFILPDTALANAQGLAEKLRKLSMGVPAPWNQATVPLSAAVVEAVSRPDYDSDDIITDLINRAEFGLEEARKKGGDTIVTQ